MIATMVFVQNAENKHEIFKSFRADFGAVYGPLIIHKLHASLHRTSVNAFKILINLYPFLLGSFGI
jgi:hypothetical protein